jgi:hypothetical protein
VTQLIVFAFVLGACAVAFGTEPTTQPITDLKLDFDTPVEAVLQKQIEQIDTTLRERFGMTPDDAAVGVVDLVHGRVAMTHPDRIEYAASVPKIGSSARVLSSSSRSRNKLDPTTRHELG